jgi:hypothetical protein
LHVLSTPPAFVLSQDQTLRQRSSRFFDTPTKGERGKDFALFWTRCPFGHRGSPSSSRRARRGWAAPGVNPIPLCWLIRSPDVPSTVAGTTHIGHVPAVPAPLTGYRALAFHTLLSFQGASWNRPCDSPGGSPRRSRRRSGGNRTLGLPGSSTEQPIPWFLRGYPPSRWFVPVRRCLKATDTVQVLQAKRRIFRWCSQGTRWRAIAGTRCRQRKAGSRVSLLGPFGATSPPALHTEAPSCAFRLRTATVAIGTSSLVALGDLLSSVLAPS